jgi:hypothetical protein
MTELPGLIQGIFYDFRAYFHLRAITITMYVKKIKKFGIKSAQPPSNIF